MTTPVILRLVLSWLAIPAVVLALVSLRGERARRAYAKRRLKASPSGLPPVTVIVPVKGRDQGLRENLAALATLDYPDYELLVVANSAAGIPAGVLPPRVKVVLAHGRDPNTGEKIQNLMAAVRASRKDSKVLAFADSDGRVSPGWLRALVAPLHEPQTGASTGYRWHTPQPAGCWALLRSVWNGAIAGTFGPGDNRFAWGGAMAMRKDLFFELRVFEHWKGSISDDYAISAAVHRAGLQIVWAPGATAACPDGTGVREFFSWMRRQMAITRVCDPVLWRLALAAHVVYCTGMAAAVAGIAGLGGGRLYAALALAAQLVPGMVKGALRASTASAALPEWRAWFRRWGWAHVLLVPLGTWLWLAALISSAFGDTVRWRGNTYRLRRPQWAAHS